MYLNLLLSESENLEDREHAFFMRIASFWHTVHSTHLVREENRKRKYRGRDDEKKEGRK